MKLNMYSIFDTKTGAYHRPIFLHSDGQAQRMFGDIAVDADHEIGKHPEDYTLFRIGVWDDQNAQTVVEAPSVICTGLEMVAQSRKVDPAQMQVFEQEVEDLENGANNSR